MTRLRALLSFSIVLNLFLAAALIAGYASLRTRDHMINAGSLRLAGAELPADERRSFRQALRQTRLALHQTVVASRQAKSEAATLLLQPVVDRNAVLAALDRARTADIAVRTAVEQRAVDFAANLPLADREKLADAMKRRAEKIAPAGE